MGNSTELGVKMDEPEQNNGNSVVKQAEYSEQQIDDYCEKVLNLCLVARTDGSLMFESVQIIKQLQEEIKSRDKLDKQNFESLRACSLSARA